MAFKKGSPEARAYMASIRAPRIGGSRPVKAKALVADAPSDGLSVTHIRDSKGNVADSLHITPEFLEMKRLEMHERQILREERERRAELRAEKKAEEEQSSLMTKLLVGGGVVLAAYLLLRKSPSTAPTA